METQPRPRKRISNAAKLGVKQLGRLRIRLILVTAVAIAALGIGAGFAFARSSTPTIGTGVVVVNTKLSYQGGAAAGTGRAGAEILRKATGLRMAVSSDFDGSVRQTHLAPGQGMLFERLGAALLYGSQMEASIPTVGK